MAPTPVNSAPSATPATAGPVPASSDPLTRNIKRVLWGLGILAGLAITTWGFVVALGSPSESAAPVAGIAMLFSLSAFIVVPSDRKDPKDLVPLLAAFALLGLTAVLEWNQVPEWVNALFAVLSTIATGVLGLILARR